MGGSGKKSRRRTFIREWRNFRGLSQAALADHVDAAQETISKLERGTINYTQPMLEAIADALKCSPADLIMRDPTREPGLWTLFENLNDADKKTAARILESLSKKPV